MSFKNSLPHWGNRCPVHANHLKTNRANLALTKQNTSKAIHQFESMIFAEYCDNIRSDLGRYDYMPGINPPYDAGITSHSSAILDTGANQNICE